MTVTVSCIFFATVLYFLKFTAVHVEMHRHMYHICNRFCFDAGQVVHPSRGKCST